MVSLEQTTATAAFLPYELIACEECGLVVDIPDIKDGQKRHVQDVDIHC